MTTHEPLAAWVDEVAHLTKPDTIHWCDGSQAEYDALIAQMLVDGTLHQLNPQSHPSSYLHRSHPTDVARTEHLTFVCTSNEEDAGPNNNWMAPDEAHRKIDALFKDSMRGRTLYVVPYCMGPIDAPAARCGVEITDSSYVVANMRLMTRMGQPALERIEREGSFVKGLHSLGDLDPDKRFIMHFPEELTIKSVGSGYGGNALLGKKCHALRIASWQARQEGWMAEHMLIVGIENPQGETRYIAAAFPSACGKTNMAMLIPSQKLAGYRIWTVGDDIAWLRPGEDGRLWAINPEAGFFGVAPGTGRDTNPNALDTLGSDCIYTNVALTADNQPWWEGLSDEQPKYDWRGQPYQGKGKAAHPNARFTVAASQCPSYSPRAEDPRGVPIDAVVFGGRRPSRVPLVYEARDWAHGVLVGASVASETTAAQSGQVGVVRRDPMAMKPFAGYNFGDYWAHWLAMGDRLMQPPRIFHVNWFRQDGDGRFMWPGFGENLRVLLWMLERSSGGGGARQSPIGAVPDEGGIDIDGLDVSGDDMRELTRVDPVAWRQEMADVGTYLEGFGARVPQALQDQHRTLMQELSRDA